MLLLGEEFRRLFQGAPDHEDERHDQAADEERNAPAPIGDLRRAQRQVQQEADDRRDEDRNLLARRLERRVEALVAGGRDLEQVDRYAAELDAGGEALQQTADQHQDRREDADGRIGGREGDGDGADRHDRQRHDQALAPADLVEIGAEHDRPDRPHQRADPERRERQHQLRRLVAGGEERLGDGPGVESEQEEIELFEEIAAGRTEDGADPRFHLWGFRHLMNSLGHRFRSSNHIDIINQPRPEERAESSLRCARLEGRPQARSCRCPSFETPCCARLLRMRPVGSNSIPSDMIGFTEFGPLVHPVLASSAAGSRQIIGETDGKAE